MYCGLQPIFVDINHDDLNMNIDDMKKKYSKDCVAVMPVHFGGHPCKMDEEIMKWAKIKKLVVIEDCAETCGGFTRIKKTRNLGGDFGC